MTEQTVLVVTQRMFKFDLKISAFGVILVTSACVFVAITLAGRHL